MEYDDSVVWRIAAFDCNADQMEGEPPDPEHDRSACAMRRPRNHGVFHVKHPVAIQNRRRFT